MNLTKYLNYDKWYNYLIKEIFGIEIGNFIIKMIKIGQKIKLLVEKYNQKGEGVCFLNNVPIYVFGTIVGEEVDVEIQTIKEKYMIGKLINICLPSINRSSINIENADKIGGYELIHMNDEEQKHFKLNKIKNDFRQIAKIDLENINWFQGQKRFKYRNKITLHDGFFYEKNSHNKIDINDFLLSDIKWNKNLKGEIIYRKLNTLIFGTKKDKKYTWDTSCGFDFRVGLNSFYQVNKEIMDCIYKEIQNWVIPNQNTLDLFSGIGTIGIICSCKSTKVVCVEKNKSSYEDAIFNVKHNNLNNVFLVKQDVKNFIKNNNEKFETVILDPARDGVKKETITNIVENIKPKRIIYLSCNPATQASDFNYLKDKYKIVFSCAYDMFPQTYHIEHLIICDLIE